MKQPRISEVLPLLETATAAVRAADADQASVSLARAAALLAAGTLDTIDRVLVRQPLARLRSALVGDPPPALQGALDAVERVAR